MLGDGERPIASGIAAIASEATYGLIIAVRDVVSKLWAQRQDEIKAACRPLLIDEVDVLAYVTADALGRPQMHPDDTNAVGKRIESCAKRIRSEKLPEATRAARRTAARAPGATKEAVAAAVAAAEAALLGQVYAGLKLPDRTVGRKRKEREQAVGEPREAEHVQHGLATVLRPCSRQSSRGPRRRGRHVTVRRRPSKLRKLRPSAPSVRRSLPARK